MDTVAASDVLLKLMIGVDGEINQGLNGSLFLFPFFSFPLSYSVFRAENGSRSRLTKTPLQRNGEHKQSRWTRSLHYLLIAYFNSISLPNL